MLSSGKIRDANKNLLFQFKILNNYQAAAIDKNYLFTVLNMGLILMVRCLLMNHLEWGMILSIPSLLRPVMESMSQGLSKFFFFFSGKFCWKYLMRDLQLFRWYYCICLVIIKGANRTMKVKRPLWEQRKMISARVKIMWEQQTVDPPIDYIERLFLWI